MMNYVISGIIGIVIWQGILKLIKFDFREHDFKKLYRSFKKNYKKADFNYDQWRKANGKRFISSFNKLNKTPECIEYFRGKNS